MQERIQKILSARGICSRRKAEEYIAQGLVMVNGVPATIGQKADPLVDRIEVAGKVLEERKELVYFLFHKPEGVLTHPFGSTIGAAPASKPGDAHSVRDFLPREIKGLVSPVGRLDKDSSGLLLLTNDGVIAYRLTHPRFDHEKEYEVLMAGAISEGALLKLEKGMTILGERTKPTRIRRLAPNKFRIALTEGKNRQIRRMCDKVGSPVLKLRRVRILTIEDDHLVAGQGRHLTPQEVSSLLLALGLDANVTPPASPAKRPGRSASADSAPPEPLSWRQRPPARTDETR